MARKSIWPVAERAETAGPLQARLVPTVHALAAVQAELGVLDVRRDSPLVVDVDELQVVELQQQEVRRVVVDAAARVVAHARQQHLEGHAVEPVFARVQLERDAAIRRIEGVVAGRVHRHKVALRTGAEFGALDAVGARHARQFVATGL